MFQSDFYVKGFFGLFCLTLITFSCRKEIEHQPSISVNHSKEGEAVDTLYEWIPIELGINGVAEYLVNFNGYMYIGTSQGEVLRMDQNMQVTSGATLPASWASYTFLPIMETLGNELLVIPNSALWSTMFGTVLSVDTQGNSTQLPLTQQFQIQTVMGLDSLSPNSFIIYGTNTANPLYIPRYVEVFENGVPQEIPDYDVGNRGFKSGTVYQDTFIGASFLGNDFVFFDGSGWQPYSLPSTTIDYVRALETFEGDLFVLGEFGSINNTRVRRYSSSSWIEYPELSGFGANGRFIKSNGELFIYSQDIEVNGWPGPIFKLEGDHWERFGKFPSMIVRDICYYGGEYYATSGGGSGDLYKRVPVQFP